MTIQDAIKYLNNVSKNLNSTVIKECKDQVDDSVKTISKTGNLANSIKISNGNVISDAPYFKIQNEGGDIYVTDDMRKKFWQLYYKTKDNKYKAMALTKNNVFKIKAKHFFQLNINKIENAINKLIK